MKRWYGNTIGKKQNAGKCCGKAKTVSAAFGRTNEQLKLCSKAERLVMNKPQLMPSRDAVTAYQTATILSIVNTMGQFLAQPDIDPAHPHKAGGAMDGGPRDSATVTFIKACERLDAILEDKSRWDLEIQRLMELQLVKLMNEQRIFLAAQTAASLALNTPTYLHQPKIINAGDGTFVALLGDPEHPACLGIGDSPEAACRDFDASFRGELTENQLKYLQEHPDNKEQTAPKQPRKKK